ncbi:hypothetical protein D3C81_1979100 [compost metagenome]
MIHTVEHIVLKRQMLCLSLKQLSPQLPAPQIADRLLQHSARDIQSIQLSLSLYIGKVITAAD